jgi:hypothetical protein
MLQAQASLGTPAPPNRDSPFTPGLPTSRPPLAGCILGACPLQREVRAYGSVPSRNGTDWILTNWVMYFSTHAPNARDHPPLLAVGCIELLG